MNRWLIYALGGGWGHLTRSIALARVARSHAEVRILTNSPYAAAVNEPGMIALDCTRSASEVRPVVRDRIAVERPDCLIVDTFPRGVVGELAGILKSFQGLKLLVARDLNPEYVEAAGLKAFIGDVYDVILNPGEGRNPTMAPWLVRSAHELPTMAQSRERLHITDDRPCIVICAAGNRNELEWYEAVAWHLAGADANVRLLRSEWPAIELYRAASVVVGGAGYNTINECLACQVPLVARPWERQYDRQHVRAVLAGERGSVRIVREPEEAATAALSVMRPPKADVRYNNGAEQAVREILSYRTRYGRPTQTHRGPAEHEGSSPRL